MEARLTVSACVLRTTRRGGSTWGVDGEVELNENRRQPSDECPHESPTTC